MDFLKFVNGNVFKLKSHVESYMGFPGKYMLHFYNMCELNPADFPHSYNFR